LSRHDAVDSALRWYIERDGDLPSIEDPMADEIEELWAKVGDGLTG
jgi:hypothetical protein